VKVLAGDVGGTNTRLAVCRVEETRVTIESWSTFASREHPSLEAILERYVDGRAVRAVDGRAVEVDAACFGVAGPVRDGRCRATNLPWSVGERDLARLLPKARVTLRNDVEANALGIPALAPDALATIRAGTRGAQVGNRAVVSAGTGLGIAGLFWDGKTHRAFATEGGHIGFTPRDARDVRFVSWLQAQLGRATAERALSGPGLINLYRFVTAEAGAPSIDLSEGAQSIARSASSDRLCGEALDWFASVYGAVASDVALALMATEGVYLGGGIAPKMLERLRGASFERAFLDKEPMRALVETIPVHVILDDRCALLGAALSAARSASL
jgi:glucokinase